MSSASLAMNTQKPPLKAVVTTRPSAQLGAAPYRQGSFRSFVALGTPGLGVIPVVRCRAVHAEGGDQADA